MAILIDEIIPQQGFEIVTNKIGAILLLEIANQITLQSLQDQVNVFIERQEPYDNSEDVVINVSCNSINPSNQNQITSEGNTTFFIDVQACGIESSIKTGNDDVRGKLQRYIGMIRYVLSSTKYQTLDFPLGLIAGKYVESIQFDDNYGPQDAHFTRFARLTFSVRIMENQNGWDGVDLFGGDSKIKLDLTDLGYKLTLIN